MIRNHLDGIAPRGYAAGMLDYVPAKCLTIDLFGRRTPAQPAHFRVLREKLHPRIEHVIDRTPISIVLRSADWSETEQIAGYRDGDQVVFDRSALYPGLTRTPYHPSLVQLVDVGVTVPR